MRIEVNKHDRATDKLIRVRAETYDRLKRIAAESGATMGHIIALAIAKVRVSRRSARRKR